MRSNKNLLNSIKILTDHLNLQYPANHNDYSNWLSTLKSLYIEYFGDDSEELRYLSLSGDLPDTTYYSSHEKIELNETHILRIRDKVNQDIKTLRIKGLPKINSQKKININNFLCDYSNSKIIFGICTIFILGMAATQGLHEIFSKYSNEPLLLLKSSNSKSNTDLNDTVGIIMNNVGNQTITFDTINKKTAK